MQATVETASRPGASRATLRRIVLLQQLALETGLSATRDELCFRILNRTIRLLPYDRASLWLGSGPRARIGGISGEAYPRADAPFVEARRDLVRGLSDERQTQVLSAEALGSEDAHRAWRSVRESLPAFTALWVPIPSGGRLVAGLLLERHAGPAWTEEEIRSAASLAVSYGIAWRPFRRRLLSTFARRRVLLASAGLLLLVVLAFLPVPLRVIAPCEVVPSEPVAVAAPMDGVIAEVVVRPGARVREGELLARYDGRDAREARAVAAEQVAIIRADLRRAKIKAFESEQDRATLRLLENRLAREEEVLARADRRVADLEVRAPADGVVVLDDPDAWRGRPAATGERICTLIDPERTRAVVWLSVDDRVDFAVGEPVSVLLRADPRARRDARLLYVAPESAPRPDGAPAFRAEAAWTETEESLPAGVQGTAVLAGDEVPLGYWLVRRPLAWLRATFGI